MWRLGVKLVEIRVELVVVGDVEQEDEVDDD